MSIAQIKFPIASPEFEILTNADGEIYLVSKIESDNKARSLFLGKMAQSRAKAETIPVSVIITPTSVLLEPDIDSVEESLSSLENHLRSLNITCLRDPDDPMILVITIPAHSRITHYTSKFPEQLRIAILKKCKFLEYLEGSSHTNFEGKISADFKIKEI